jgi:hypothetical protein
VLVASDRVYYNRMKASGAVFGSAVEFPAHTSERRIRLVGKEMRIGRRSAARDLVPEIDLADKPVDPGVSRLHAVLASASDGTWFISDPGSANGTFVNNRELDVGERVTLHEGDRINLGASRCIAARRGLPRLPRRPPSSGMNYLKPDSTGPPVRRERFWWSAHDNHSRRFARPGDPRASGPPCLVAAPPGRGDHAREAPAATRPADPAQPGLGRARRANG